MYYVHNPPGCPELTAKYPHAATYVDGQVIVVGESFANHVSEVVDISSLELNGEGESAITEAELDAKVDEFLAGDGDMELVVSKVQGLYLYNKHKPVIEEEVL